MQKGVTPEEARTLRRSRPDLEANLAQAIEIVDSWGSFEVSGVDISEGLYIAVWANLCDANCNLDLIPNIRRTFFSIAKYLLKSIFRNQPTLASREIFVLVPGSNANIVRMLRPVLNKLGLHRISVVSGTAIISGAYFENGNKAGAVGLEKVYSIGFFKALLILLHITWKTIFTWKKKPGYIKWASIIIREAFYCSILTYQLDERLEQISPKVVVTTSDAAMGDGLLIELAARRGIRSVVLQHGFPVYNTFLWRPQEDVFCAFGDVDREMALSIGLDPEQIQITGSPEFEEPEICSKEDIRNMLGIPPNTKVVLVVTNNERHVRQHLVDKLLLILEKLPDIQFWFRLHPMELLEDYSRMIPEEVNGQVHFFDNKQFSCDEMCCIAECVVGVTTTFLVHAILRHKPCIMITPPGKVLGIFQIMAEKGMLSHVTDEEQLLTAINTCLDDDNANMRDYTSIAKSLVTHTGSDAAKRIADLIG